MFEVPALRKTSFLVVLLASLTSLATRTAQGEDQSLVSWSGFVDTTIAFDFNELPTRYRPYSTQPYYSDEPALNLGFIDATLNSEHYRGRIAAQYGSSVIANYAAESGIFSRYIQEAYGGITISKDMQLDAGIFLSHLGLESWISRNNFTVSRSLVADYSPYYQSGLRLLLSLSDRLKGELHLLRGWQNITNDSNPALGTRLSYSASDNLELSHNLFIGNLHGERTFSNVNANYSLTQRVDIASCFDLGVQKRQDENTAVWYGWAVLARYKLNHVITFAGRVERYSDPHQIIIDSLSAQSFNATGLSINIDYKIEEGITWRNEYRALFSSHDVFPRRDSFSSSDSFIVSSILISLG